MRTPGIGNEASPLPNGSKKRLSALYARSNNPLTVGLYPIRAFASTRYTNFPTVSIIDAMRRGRLCWRLLMGVEGRAIGRGELELRHSRLSKTAVEMPSRADDALQGLGILRLRMTSTSWASCFAQDDRAFMGTQGIRSRGRRLPVRRFRDSLRRCRRGW